MFARGVAPDNANFNLVAENAAHDISGYVIHDYVKCSYSGCHSDADLFGSLLHIYVCKT